MTDILSFIESKMQENEIPYEFGEWTDTVTYPYSVGTFQETEHRFEDGYSGGTFTLDAWSRGSKLSLTELSDKVKSVFDDLFEVVDDHTFYISYGGVLTVPTGEADLFRVQITLYTKDWKGIGE